MELKRIGVLSTAKVLGALYALIGLLIGLVFACMGLVSLAGILADLGSDVDSFFGGFGVISVIIGLCAFPIMYGIIGAIGGAIGALFYNLIAGWIGGIEMEFSEYK